MIVLDTDVLSALMRPRLNLSIVAWLDSQPRPSIWTTAITILELRSGLLLLPDGRRKRELESGLHVVLAEKVVGKVLPFDLPAAEAAAAISAARVSRGRNIGTMDTQIAGIIASRGATLVTRNVKDFDDLGVPLVNPWDA